MDRIRDQNIVPFIGPKWAHITGHRLVPFMGYKIFYIIFFFLNIIGFFYENKGDKCPLENSK